MTPTLLLSLVLIAQVETTTEPPTETPPATSDAPPPTDRAARVRDAVKESGEPAKPVDDKKPAVREKNRFERLIESGPGHYLFYYAPDYVTAAGMGAVLVSSFVFPPPPASRSAFGPSFNPGEGDTTEVFDVRYDRLLGGQFREDTVHAFAPALIGNAAMLGLGAVTLIRDRTFRKIHHFLLGAAQAQLTTGVITELSKAAFGRLRPDYRDRMARYYCAPDRGPVPGGVDCAGVRAEADRLSSQGRSTEHVWIDAREFDNGRRSFPSGHASSAFSIATYFALFVGGEYVWGENASAATRLPGVFAQAAALTAALFVAGSRLTDNRHHPEDVLVGAGLGSAMSALFYFLHFDLQGRPLIRSVSFAPSTSGSGFGLNISGFF